MTDAEVRAWIDKSQRMARRYERGRSNEDPESAALLGLAQAVVRYQPERATFNTYGTTMVRGWIYRDRRDSGPGTRTRCAALELGRAERETCELPPLSIEQAYTEDGKSLEERVADPRQEAAFRSIEDAAEREELWRAVLDLPKQMRLAVWFRYHESYTMEQVAGLLGMSRAYAYTVVYQGLARLRKSASLAALLG